MDIQKYLGDTLCKVPFDEAYENYCWHAFCLVNDLDPKDQSLLTVYHERYADYQESMDEDKDEIYQKIIGGVFMSLMTFAHDERVQLSNLREEDGEYIVDVVYQFFLTDEYWHRSVQ